MRIGLFVTKRTGTTGICTVDLPLWFGPEGLVRMAPRGFGVNCWRSNEGRAMTGVGVEPTTY